MVAPEPMVSPSREDGALTGSAPSYVYAGFWWRALAFALDTLVLVGCAGLLLSAIAAVTGEAVQGPRQWVALLAQWAYYAGFEASAWRATPGKRWCGLLVVDLDGRQLTLPRATVRFAGEMLSGFLLGIGYWMAAFTPRKQGLHDLIAGTVVLRRG
jgi:uncharacterized RDD family membrane protein YckC